MQRGFLESITMVQTCMDSPARGSSSSLLVEGSGSSRIPRESAPEMATAESLVEELSEDAGGELRRGEKNHSLYCCSLYCFPINKQKRPNKNTPNTHFSNKTQ